MSKFKALRKELYCILNYARSLTNGLVRQWKKNTGLKKHRTLEQVIQEASEQTGHKRCNLVGHSFGGLSSLIYTLENPEKVSTCITIASPFNGTTLADLSYLFLPLGVYPKTVSQLRRGNDFLKRVQAYFRAHAGNFEGTSFENIFSIHDEFISEEDSQLKIFAPDAENVNEYMIRGDGHGALMHNDIVHKRIINLLTESELPTIFLHGFGMDQSFFKKTFKKMKQNYESVFTPENEKKIFMFTYDFTELIKAEKIERWYKRTFGEDMLKMNLLNF